MHAARSAESKLLAYRRENESLRRDNQDLADRARALNDRVSELEQLVAGYEQVQALSDHERREADEVIHAHEAVEELARQEIIELKTALGGTPARGYEERLLATGRELADAERTIGAFAQLQEFQRSQFMYYDDLIKAYENVGDLVTHEMRQMRAVIRAHEAVEELARSEMLELRERQSRETGGQTPEFKDLQARLAQSERTLEALESLQNRQRETKINLDQTIQAYKALNDLSRDELDSAYRTIRIHEEIEKLTWDEKKEVDTDLLLAQKVQFGLISKDMPGGGPVSVSHRYLPSTRLGGDFFGVKPGRDGRLCLLISDAAGHGTQAALITMIVKTLFEELAPRYVQPGAFLHSLNERLFNIIKDLKTFITACYVVIDPATGHVSYANGGHPYAVRLRADGTLEALERTGPLLGAFDNMRYRTRNMDLAAGESLFLYTDGAAECTGKGEEEFGSERVHDYLAAARGDSDDKLLDGLHRRLINHRGSTRLEDDVSFVILRYNGPAGAGA